MATDYLQIFNKRLADELIEKNVDEFKIWNSCFSQDEIYLDYYGCFAHLDGFEWENTISSLEIFPDNEDGETFFLLQSNHIDKIVKSLRENIKKLTIMTEKEIDRIIEFKDFCDQHEGFMVAYMIDF